MCLMKKYIKLFIAMFFLVSVHFSCKREFEKPRWNTEILAPLVKSRLTINNIIKDTSQIKKESDKSISLVSRKEIFNYTIDSIVSLDAPQFKKTVKLESLVLADQSVTRRISLGEIALQLLKGSPSDKNLGAAILAANALGKFGQKFDFSGVTGVTTGPISVDVNKFFRTADLKTGQLQIAIKNELPLTVTNLEFSINNLIPPSNIITQSYSNILPNETRSTSKDLAGLTIGSMLEATILDLGIGSGKVIIDTSNAILVTLSISNVTVNSATAIFPEQEVVNETSNVELMDLNNVELTQTIIRTGTVRADVYSTAEDTVRFTYEIPAALKNGQPFVFEAVVPPAPPNGTSHAVFNKDFSGYTLDLRGIDGLQYNTFYNVLKGKINYTGRVVNLSLEDSLDITLTLVDPKPSYAKGYLGQSELVVGPGDVSVGIFDNISADILNFSSASIDVVIENALGIPGEGSVGQITASNTKTGASLTLTGAPLNQNFPIAPATDAGGYPIPVSSTIDLSTGSNATALLNLLPNKFSYAGDFKLNSAGNSGTHTDFAYSGVDLKAYLDIKIPLSIIASNLVLSDTAKFNIPELKTSGLQKGKFNLLVWNGFPYDVKVDMRFLDRSGIQVDSIITTTIISAAAINGSGRVVESKYSSVEFQLSPAMIYKLSNQVTDVVFTARFDTQPVNTHVSIYDDYAIDFKLVGDMNVQVNSGK